MQGPWYQDIQEPLWLLTTLVGTERRDAYPSSLQGPACFEWDREPTGLGVSILRFITQTTQQSPGPCHWLLITGWNPPFLSAFRLLLICGKLFPSFLAVMGHPSSTCPLFHKLGCSQKTGVPATSLIPFATKHSWDRRLWVGDESGTQDKHKLISQ